MKLRPVSPSFATKPMLTRVYNAGDLGHLACGWRSLIVLPPGRKWVTLVDWTTLETARVPLALWQRIPKSPTTDFSRRRVRAYMIARCRYAMPTAMVKEAIRLMGRRPPVQSVGRPRPQHGSAS